MSLAGALALVFAFVCLHTPARYASGSGDRPLVAVSTSLLELTVRELWGDRVRTYLIIPPGACPGHYDIKAQDVAQVGKADLVILHDYQESMRRKLEGSGMNIGPVVMVPESGSLITPPGYRGMLAKVAQAGEEAGLGKPALAEAQGGVDKIAETAARKAAPLQGIKVVAALHQTDFCGYYGLEVVAVIPPSGDISARELDNIMKKAREQKARAVVGNMQSGGQDFEVVAKRLGVPVVMLTNFPLPDDFSYQGILSYNLEALEKVLVDPAPAGE